MRRSTKLAFGLAVGLSSASMASSAHAEGVAFADESVIGYVVLTPSSENSVDATDVSVSRSVAVGSVESDTLLDDPFVLKLAIAGAVASIGVAALVRRENSIYNDRMSAPHDGAPA